MYNKLTSLCETTSVKGAYLKMSFVLIVLCPVTSHKMLKVKYLDIYINGS